MNNTKRKSLIIMIRNAKKDDVLHCRSVLCRNCFYGVKGEEKGKQVWHCSEKVYERDYEGDYIKAYGEESFVEEML